MRKLISHSGHTIWRNYSTFRLIDRKLSSKQITTRKTVASIISLVFAALSVNLNQDLVGKTIKKSKEEATDLEPHLKENLENDQKLKMYDENLSKNNPDTDKSNSELEIKSLSGSIVVPNQLRPSKKVKILSLDGGGIRGILTLNILREIEYRLSKPIHEIFDFFSGTSTGGIIALGLTKKQPYLEADIFYKKITGISAEQSVRLYAFLKENEIIDENGNINKFYGFNLGKKLSRSKYVLGSYKFYLHLPVEFLPYEAQIIAVLRDPSTYRNYPQYSVEDLLSIYENRGKEIFSASEKSWRQSFLTLLFTFLCFPLVTRFLKSFKDVAFPQFLSAMAQFMIGGIVSFLPDLLFSLEKSWIQSFLTLVFTSLCFPLITPFLKNFKDVDFSQLPSALAQFMIGGVIRNVYEITPTNWY